MVEGNNAILFLESGSSKNDFLRILCDSPSYYEGQLILLYERYLSRTPSTLEMADGALLYQSSASFIEVAKSILSTDEFIGIQ